MEVFPSINITKPYFIPLLLKMGQLLSKVTMHQGSRKTRLTFLYVKLGLSIYSYCEAWSHKKEIKSM